MNIRKAEDQDWPRIWPIFREVVRAGDTYAFSPDTSEDEARRIWQGDGVTTYVAVDQEIAVGTYILKANHPGLGDHVANAAFMVASEARGQGIGRSLAEHALMEARAAGYHAMQFNFVVSTNKGSIRVWESLGFEIVGTLPGAFRHHVLGGVDAYVMFRWL